MFPIESLRNQIWPWLKVNQGQHMIIIWTNYDGRYIPSFLAIGPPVPEKSIEGFFTISRIMIPPLPDFLHMHISSFVFITYVVKYLFFLSYLFLAYSLCGRTACFVSNRVEIL